MYLRERESVQAGGGGEGSRLPPEQGGRCRARSQDPGVTT